VNESVLCVCEGKKKKLGNRRKRKHRPTSMADIQSFFCFGLSLERYNRRDSFVN
jgi:hypothetical protein